MANTSDSDHPNQPRSLLRRLLNRASEMASTPAPPDAESSPVGLSPVRPTPPTPPQPSTPATSPLTPKPRATQTQVVPQTVASPEDRLKAETALEQIRQKTAQVAVEFSQGKINRAQFTALYAHYNEKRVIIERLLQRDPDTHAWQSVATPGRTTFLRAHFEARVLSYAIYEHKPPYLGQVLASQGTPLMEADFAGKIVAAVVMLAASGKPASGGRKPIDNGRWIVVAPGEHTTALAVFSLEPSARQITRIQDTHRDFERANHHSLLRGVRQADQYVFPHRALFASSLEMP